MSVIFLNCNNSKYFGHLVAGFLSLHVKFGYSEKATKFEKIFHLKFDVTENIRTLVLLKCGFHSLWMTSYEIHTLILDLVRVGQYWKKPLC